MKKRIVWHPDAKEDLRNILIYCRDEFGNDTASKVRNRILGSVSNLSLNPQLGFIDHSFDGTNSLIYRSIIIRQTKVIYSVHENYIYIHLLWNTWRSPSSLTPLAKNRS